MWKNKFYVVRDIVRKDKYKSVKAEREGSRAAELLLEVEKNKKSRDGRRNTLRRASVCAPWREKPAKVSNRRKRVGSNPMHVTVMIELGLPAGLCRLSTHRVFLRCLQCYDRRRSPIREGLK